MRERQQTAERRQPVRETMSGDAVTRALGLATTARGITVEALIPNLVSALKAIAIQAGNGEAPQPAALEPELGAAARADREGIVAALSGLIAIRLIDRRQTSEVGREEKKLSPDLLLGITDKLAGDLAGENTYSQQLAQWLAAGAQAWATDLTPLDDRGLAEHVLRLAALPGAEAPGDVV